MFKSHLRVFLLGLLIWVLSFPLAASRPMSPSRVVPTSVVLTASNAIDAQDRLFQLQRRMLAERTISVFELATPPAPPTSPSFRVVPFRVASTARPLPAPARPGLPANWIIIKGLSVSQPVGWYTDCSGHAPVPTSGTWRWSCAGANNTYIMAHNPGIFTPILSLHPGDLVQYIDPNGHLHTYRVASVAIVANSELWPLAATSQAELTLQTCWTPDGSQDFIVRAIQI